MKRNHKMLLLAAGLIAAACLFAWAPGAYSTHEAKQAVAENLIDPSSAEFRGLKTYHGTVCGQVNGKNRMGAYTGYKLFILKSDGYTSFEPQVEFKSDDELATMKSSCESAARNMYSAARPYECTAYDEAINNNILALEYQKTHILACDPDAGRAKH